MLALSQALMREKDFAQLINRIDGGGCPLVYSGLSAIHKAHAAAAVRRITGRPVFIVCSDESEAEHMRSDMAIFSEEDVFRLGSRDFSFYNVDSVSRDAEHERIKVFSAMAAEKAGIVVATAEALLTRTMPKDKLMSSVYSIKCGDEISIEQLVEKLLACGYKHCDQVEGMGQFAVRGGIVDFYSPAFAHPVRCEFFGDEIDSMGIFDISNQRRLENIFQADILPCAEILPGLCDGGEEGFIKKLETLLSKYKKRKNPNEELIASLTADIQRLQNRLPFYTADRYIPFIYDHFETASDYIPEDAIVILSEPSRIEERCKNYVWQLSQDLEALITRNVLDGSLSECFINWDSCCSILADLPIVMLDNFLGSRYPVAPRALLNITAKQLPSYGGSLQTAASDIVHYMKEGYRVVVLCSDQRKAELMNEHLATYKLPVNIDFNLTKLPDTSVCSISVGLLSAGFEYPGIKLAVITEGQLSSGKAYLGSKKKKTSNRSKLQSYTDLSRGDLVVHVHHGIGRFEGIFKMHVDGVDKDYIKISYAGKDCLYVPATQLDLVSKYIGSGGEDRPVKLNKLGGTEWQRTKSRAKAAAKDLAKGLIQLYAERSRRPGYAFSEDTEWQREFEDKFEYSETSDQLKAISEIKKDMEKSTPMDRLLCGDVGFGKTEVALRAVMKCIMDGKQAAILVPTTVLAQQHYVTAIKRFSGYPVQIEVLSRFKSSNQMQESIRKIKNGTADVIIGTHRLIQKDVKFNDLGLLVVDEEQRFGVTHKEKLKEISKQVDVLTLSATPIPRTLNMALAGIRDMSLLEDPPTGRHPVQTYVLEHNWSVIADAIRRETARGGQVYYLHNRVETIDQTATYIANLVEGISVGVAHGKMSEEMINSVMDKVSGGEIQVLVCTTIIETGIDIPNVNTLIIEDADKLGLAQLHQIRGRVGRSSRHAFAYLTYRQGKVLTEVASKRLSAIREFAEFNSGVKIAMRDLEIRGAGNLLGSEQSGHMISVGFDMYLKLLEEAVLEEKGEKSTRPSECSADINVSAGISDDYIETAEQRMDIYRRIALIESEEDADDIIDELIDRFGEPPENVNTLVGVALLRVEAAAAGISDISQRSGRLYFKLTDFSMECISGLYNMQQFRGRVKVEAGADPSVSVKIKYPKEVLDEAFDFVKAYRKMQDSEKQKGEINQQ